MSSDADNLPEHVDPNVSCLEPHRSEVAQARRRRWPYQAIATLLHERHGLRISSRAVCGFCLRRGIVKGKGETRTLPAELGERRTAQSSPADVLRPTRSRRTGNVFKYDDDGPLKTRTNGLLDAG
jgi:hypothetical protein